MNWTINQTVDLSRGYTPVVWPDALMVSGDDKAHTWRVSVMVDGKVENVSSATVTGYFLRSDGSTVQVVGSMAGNLASVTLTQECYAVEGKLLGTMRMVRYGATVTLASVIFHVRRLISGDVVNPGVSYQNYLLSASPKGVYANLTALAAANPDRGYVYITQNDGNWNYWNGSTWVSGGIYQTLMGADVSLMRHGYAAEASAVAGVISGMADGHADYADNSRWVSGSYTDMGKFSADSRRIRLSAPFPVYKGQVIRALGQGQYVSVILLDRIAYTGDLNADFVDYDDATAYPFALGHSIKVTKDTYCLFLVATGPTWETSTTIAVSDLKAICNVDMLPGTTEAIDKTRRLVQAGYTDAYGEPSRWEPGTYNIPSKFVPEAKRIRLAEPFEVFEGQRIEVDGYGQYVLVVLLDRVDYTGDLNTDYVDYVDATIYPFAAMHDIIVPADKHCFFIAATGPTWESSNPILPADLTAKILVYNGGSSNPDELSNLLQTVPEYLQDHVKAKAEVARSRQTADSLSFAFLPDLHHLAVLPSNRSKFSVINWLEREIDMKVYISPGDMLFSQGTTKQQALDNLTDINRQLHRKDKLLTAVGNHDNNRDFDDLRLITPSELFGRSFKQFEDKAVFDAANREGSYYYYDIPGHKVRFVVLNTCDLPYDLYENDELKYAPNTTYAISQDQLDFVANVALDFTGMPGWSVIAVTHAPLLKQADLGPNSPYVGDVINSDVAMGIFNAFRAGSAYASTTTSGDFAQSVTVDFTQQGPQQIRCYLFGHYHHDQIAQKDGVKHIGALPVHYFVDGEPGTSRAVGTINEIAFDIITIDLKTNGMHLTRFGAGSDRTA